MSIAKDALGIAKLPTVHPPPIDFHKQKRVELSANNAEDPHYYRRMVWQKFTNN